MQIEIAHRQNRADQDDADHHHQGIGVTRRGDEAWQMMGGGWMKCFAHATLRSDKATDTPSVTQAGVQPLQRLHTCTKLKLGKLKLPAHLVQRSRLTR